MSISDFGEKIKPFYTLLLLVVVASIFFGLGRLSALEERHKPIRVTYPNITQGGVALGAIGDLLSTSTERVTSPSGSVIGSKSGKKYYFPWCGTVKRIKPENQVNFGSIEEARRAGFTPGGNCKGLK